MRAMSTIPPRRAALFATGAVVLFLAAGLPAPPAQAFHYQSTPNTCAQPGPDAGGYVCEVVYFEWISTFGATKVPLGDNQVSAAVPLPFTFRWYGVEYKSVHIASDGYLCFEQASCPSVQQAPAVPSADDPDGFIGCYMEDLNPAASWATGVKYTTVGTAPNRIFVVEWIAPAKGGFYNNHFAVWLFERDGIGQYARCYLRFVYSDGDGVPQVTVAENGAGTAGLLARSSEGSTGYVGYRWFKP